MTRGPGLRWRRREGILPWRIAAQWFGDQEWSPVGLAARQQGVKSGFSEGVMP